MNISTLTRDELRVLASKQKIPGRGSMNKAQLLEAIQDTMDLMPVPQPTIVEVPQPNPTAYNPNAPRLINKQRKRSRQAQKAQEYLNRQAYLNRKAA